MKGIKLKALYLSEKDILVCPPQFLCLTNKTKHKINQNITEIEDLSRLQELIRGRRINKTPQKSQKFHEQEQVKNLSQFRNSSKSPSRSPTRRYTFRRNFSIASNVSVNSPSRVIQSSPSVINTTPQSIFAITLKKILEKNKATKKQLQKNKKEQSVSNHRFEIHEQKRFKEIQKEIKKSSRILTDIMKEIEAAKQKLKQIENEFEKTLEELIQREAQAINKRNWEKNKKNSIGEEDKYFIEREQIRAKKQEVHKKFIEEKEKFELNLSFSLEKFEEAQDYKRGCKKELEERREILVNFYCNILKEGLDIREDGIRWAIKSLWKMNEAVPISTFPKYLDDDSAHFLLSISRKDLEYEKVLEKAEIIKKKIHEKRPQSTNRSSPHQLIKLTKQRIRQLSQVSVGYNLRGHTAENSSIKRQPESSTVRSQLHEELNLLKKSMNNLSAEIEELSIVEIKRVCEEFQKQKIDTSLEHIVDSLFGDKVKDFKKYI